MKHDGATQRSSRREAVYSEPVISSVYNFRLRQWERIELTTCKCQCQGKVLRVEKRAA